MVLVFMRSIHRVVKTFRDDRAFEKREERFFSSASWFENAGVFAAWGRKRRRILAVLMAAATWFDLSLDRPKAEITKTHDSWRLSWRISKSPDTRDELRHRVESRFDLFLFRHMKRYDEIHRHRQIILVCSGQANAMTRVLFLEKRKKLQASARSFCVTTKGNRFDPAVVWPYEEGDRTKIRCLVPGAGT